MKRLSIVLVLLLLACSLVTAQAQQETASYPTKPIDFVIASSAGSGGDVLTRLIAKYMSEELGVGINVPEPRRWQWDSGGTIGIECKTRRVYIPGRPSVVQFLSNVVE